MIYFASSPHTYPRYRIVLPSPDTEWKDDMWESVYVKNHSLIFHKSKCGRFVKFFVTSGGGGGKSHVLNGVMVNGLWSSRSSVMNKYFQHTVECLFTCETIIPGELPLKYSGLVPGAITVRYARELHPTVAFVPYREEEEIFYHLAEIKDRPADLLLPRKDSILAKICVLCNKDADMFVDKLSAGEYTISGLCQACQDGIYE